MEGPKRIKEWNGSRRERELVPRSPRRRDLGDVAGGSVLDRGGEGGGGAGHADEQVAHERHVCSASSDLGDMISARILSRDSVSVGSASMSPATESGAPVQTPRRS